MQAPICPPVWKGTIFDFGVSSYLLVTGNSYYSTPTNYLVIFLFGREGYETEQPFYFRKITNYLCLLGYTE